MFCYALTPSDGSEWRARIEAEAEHFVDVSTSAAADIARRISADGIHVSSGGGGGGWVAASGQLRLGVGGLAWERGTCCC